MPNDKQQSTKQGTPRGRALDAAALQRRIPACMVQDRRRIARRLRRLKGRRDQTVLEGGLLKIASIIDASSAQAASRRARLPVVPQRTDLPIEAMRAEIETAIAENQVVIVQGETGSGKTTRLGPMCLGMGRGVFGGIAHTQPRRIAARSVAKRIAWECGPDGDALIGYHVRFDRTADADTLMTIMTDGVLLATIKSDPKLERWDTIILDEAHERSLNIDFLIGVIRQLLPKRPDLRVIVTSATIDAQRFSKAFDDAPVLTIPGRTYPVDIVHMEPSDTIDEGNVDALSKAVLAGVRAAEERIGGQGDMLVFLPGEGEIRSSMRRLEGQLGARFDIVPLYARLSAAAQDNVLRGGPRRRIICATNVAETSLTVPGIRAVIDSGLARVSRFSANRHVQRLPLEGISKASAQQRAGRAGRLGPGVCVRLWSADSHEDRDEALDPELRRCDLAGVLLRMADLNLGDALAFPFLDPPKAATVRAGERVLEELGALKGGSLTSIGRRMASLPVAPRVARMLIAAQSLGCAASVLVIAAGVSIPDPRLRPHGQEAEAAAAHKPFVHATSDFMTLLALWNELARRIRDEGSSATRRWCLANHVSWVRVIEWRDLVHQLRRALRSGGRVGPEETASPNRIHKALLTGLLMQVGHRTQEGDYEAAGNRRFHLHPSSPLATSKPQWVMVGELVETSRLFGRLAAVVHAPWIENAAGHLIEYRYEQTQWDSSRGEATSARRALLRGLTISKGHRVPLAGIEPDSARLRFIDHGLVDGDCRLSWADFPEANTSRLRDLAERTAKVRRQDLVRGPSARFDYFQSVLPMWVHSLDTLRQWMKQEATADAQLCLPEACLLDDDAARVLDAHRTQQQFPDALEIGGGVCPVVYRHRPGEHDDGLSIRIPLDRLALIDEARLGWLVEGMRSELVETMLRGLPKAQRRAIAPLHDTVLSVLEQLPTEPQGDLASAIERVSPVAVAASSLRAVDLPAHLVVRFEVIAEHNSDGEADIGTVLGVGRDLARLRRELGPRHARVMQALLDGHPLHNQPVDVWPTPSQLGGHGQLPAHVHIRDRSALLVLGARQGSRGRVVELVIEFDQRVAHHRHRLGVRSLLRQAMGEPLLSAVQQSARFALWQRWALLVRGPKDAGDAELTRDTPESALHALCELTVECACGLDPMPSDQATFEAAQRKVWDALVPSAESVVSIMANHVQQVALLLDALGQAGMPLNGDRPDGRYDTLVREIHEQARWLSDRRVPCSLPMAWWRQPAVWAQLATAALAAHHLAGGGDAGPYGSDQTTDSVASSEIMPWLERLATVERHTWHPAVVQMRLLVESWRASRLDPKTAAVRVNEQVLEQQWSVVAEALA